jgi:hypothetical protein
MRIQADPDPQLTYNLHACRDGVACLSDNCVRRILADIATYLDNKSLHLSRAAFLTACGFRSLRELSVDSTFGDQVSYIQHQKCRGDLKRDGAKSVELQPSDRPGEVTIVTLKRFECIEVADLDEVGGSFHSSLSTYYFTFSTKVSGVPVDTVHIFMITICIFSSVADQGCFSRIRIFSIPDPIFSHPGSTIRIKEFKYFNPKNCF